MYFCFVTLLFVLSSAGQEVIDRLNSTIDNTVLQEQTSSQASSTQIPFRTASSSSERTAGIKDSTTIKPTNASSLKPRFYTNRSTVDNNLYTLISSTPEVNAARTDIWRWLVVAFCVIVLFVIGIMVILLCKRKKGKRQRRKQFYKHDLSTTSGITPSNLSSFPESSVEF